MIAVLADAMQDWVTTDDSQGKPCPWVYVGPSAERHDPSHLVTHRVMMPLPSFVGVAGAVAAAASEQQQIASRVTSHYAASSSLSHRPAKDLSNTASVNRDAAEQVSANLSGYAKLLLALDAVVSHEMDVAMASIPHMSEPLVARQLTQELPAGHGIFLGNSMPIRDIEMYGTTPRSQRLGTADRCAAGAASSSNSNDRVPTSIRTAAGAPLGAPVAANRGASGIDGVVSTAAGFAEGLSRPVTLLIGDLSFLHDINGLNLLRSGESRPPLTIVLVNNAGGGIFSFLPIAGAVAPEQFTPLWATPQNVDLEGG